MEASVEIDAREVEALFIGMEQKIPIFLRDVISISSKAALAKMHKETRKNWITGQFHGSMDIHRTSTGTIIGPQTFKDRRELWVKLGVRGTGRVPPNPYDEKTFRWIRGKLPQIMNDKASELLGAM